MKQVSFDKIKAVLDRVPAEMEGIEAKIGWFPSAKYKDGTPVAYVAAIAEFGAPEVNIPARPILKPTVERDKKTWVRQLGLGVNKVLDGRIEGRQVLEAIAISGATGVQKSIAEVHTPALSPITLMLRGMRAADPNLVVTGKTVGEAAAKVLRNEPDNAPSIKPLVDTGYMLATAQGVVGESE